MADPDSREARAEQQLENVRDRAVACYIEKAFSAKGKLTAADLAAAEEAGRAVMERCRIEQRLRAEAQAAQRPDLWEVMRDAVAAGLSDPSQQDLPVINFRICAELHALADWIEEKYRASMGILRVGALDAACRLRIEADKAGNWTPAALSPDMHFDASDADSITVGAEGRVMEWRETEAGR